MATFTDDSPLSLNDPAGVRQVRQVLDHAAYDAPGIASALGLKDLPSSRQRREQRAQWLWLTRDGSPLQQLVRLFLLHEPLDGTAFRHAVQPSDPQTWADLGLVSIDATRVTACFELIPEVGLLLAVDWPRPPDQARNQVMDIAGSTQALLDFTIRRPAGTILDLGTGCGVQALRAAAHAKSVVGVDANIRAVNVARFNAQLNDIANVEFLESDFFSAVHGRQFDRVIGNPPFLIAPKSRYLFNDSGRKADGLCEFLARQAPAYLVQGGFCQLVCNWVQIRGQDWDKRLAAWFDNSGCDIWVLRLSTEDVATYVATQAWPAEGHDRPMTADEFARWMQYYNQEAVTAIDYGIITMRKASGRPSWLRCEQATLPVGPGHEAIEAGFDRFDFLERVQDDKALLAARLRRSPNLRWEQGSEPSDNGWSVVRSRLRLVRGFEQAGNADARVLALLARCQGKEKLADVLKAVAGPGPGDWATRTQGGLALVRKLLAQGLLLPPADST